MSQIGKSISRDVALKATMYMLQMVTGEKPTIQWSNVIFLNEECSTLKVEGMTTGDVLFLVRLSVSTEGTLDERENSCQRGNIYILDVPKGSTVSLNGWHCHFERRGREYQQVEAPRALEPFCFVACSSGPDEKKILPAFEPWHPLGKIAAATQGGVRVRMANHEVIFVRSGGTQSTQHNGVVYRVFCDQTEAQAWLDQQ